MVRAMRFGEFRTTRSTQPLDLHASAHTPQQSLQLGRVDLDVPMESFVVALCMDPASAGDARRFMYFVALLEALRKPVVGVLPAASWNLERAVRWVRTTGPRWQFRVIEAPMQACWDAIDLGVMMAAPWVLDRDRPGLGTLRSRLARMVGSAHAAGTPVIWAGDAQPMEHYPQAFAEQLHSQTDEPRLLAYKAAELLDDAELTRTVSESLRAHEEARS